MATIYMSTDSLTTALDILGIARKRLQAGEPHDAVEADLDCLGDFLTGMIDAAQSAADEHARREAEYQQTARSA